MSRADTRGSSGTADDGDDEFFDAEALDEQEALKEQQKSDKPSSDTVKSSKPVSPLEINTLSVGSAVSKDSPPITEKTDDSVPQDSTNTAELESKSQTPPSPTSGTAPAIPVRPSSSRPPSSASSRPSISVTASEPSVSNSATRQHVFDPRNSMQVEKFTSTSPGPTVSSANSGAGSGTVSGTSSSTVAGTSAVPVADEETQVGYMCDQEGEDSSLQLFSHRTEDTDDAAVAPVGGAGALEVEDGDVDEPTRPEAKSAVPNPFDGSYQPQAEQLQQQQKDRMAAAQDPSAAAGAADSSTPAPAPAAPAPQEEDKKKAGFFRRFLGKDSSKPKPAPTQSNHIPVKVKKKTHLELSSLSLLQTLGQHVGAIWCLEWSHCGQLLATGGQDGTVIVWAALGSEYSREISARMGKGASQPEVLAIGCPPDGKPILHPVPYAVFCGHKADVIDVAWSRGNFLLSASIDKTARLWHLSKPRCLMVFQHTDFVTAVAFHPIEDRYFLSGSFDRKLRIWNIPHHKVVEWTRTPAIVTSASFSPDGYTAVAGLYQGQVILYHTEQLRYKTQLDCRNRSGKDSGGRKVTGVCFSDDGCYLLVTTNDSRVRLFNTDDFRMVSKYKGLVNTELQIKARLGPGYTRILSGSEDGHVYLWDVSLEDRKDNHIDSYESFNANHGGNDSQTVTCADFVPFNTVRCASGEDTYKITHMIIACGTQGDMRIFENTAPPVKL